MICEYCNTTFTDKYVLGNHQKRAKYCIEIQKEKGIISENNLYQCEYCQISIAKNTKSRHLQTCKLKTQTLLNESYNKIKELEKLIIEKDKKIENIEAQLSIYKNLSADSQQCIKEIAKQPHYIEPTIDIFEEDETDNEENEEYKLLPLNVGENYTIENREEDNYINVTNMCKAGDKKFNDWKRIDRTKDFLKVLSMQTGIPASTLISIEQTSSTDKATWVHPQVAINIAQWISPEFDVKVSAWIYEVMMTGKVDITNTKSYRQLQQENKEKQIKINYLTRKYVKRIPRTQFEEKNVMYILTTQRLKKDNIYILGKASNLTSRLSTYNKTDEHEVIYYEQCLSEENMSIVENMVFSKLKEYREVANRERFILPEEEKIDKFIFAIKECIRFLR